MELMNTSDDDRGVSYDVLQLVWQLMAMSANGRTSSASLSRTKLEEFIDIKPH